MGRRKRRVKKKGARWAAKGRKVGQLSFTKGSEGRNTLGGGGEKIEGRKRPGGEGEGIGALGKKADRGEKRGGGGGKGLGVAGHPLKKN